MNILQNIPPLWTAAAQWLSAFLYLSLLPRRQTGWRYWISSVPFLGIQCIWMSLIGNLQGSLFNLGMTISAALTLLPFIMLGKQLSIYRTLYYCARAFLLSGFSVSLGWQLYSYCIIRLNMNDVIWFELAIMLPTIALSMLLVQLLDRRRTEAVQEMDISSGACHVVVLLTLVIYILSSLSYATIDTPFSAQNDIDAFNLRTWIYLGGIAMMFAFHFQLCDDHTRHELLTMQSILEMQRANYLYSKEAVELVERKYHDLKHQIAVLRSDITNEEKLKGLDRMEAEIRAYEAENKTGNPVLDVVLTGKAIICQNKGIELTSVVDGSAIAFMEMMDISNLFGNMLDNAIEANEKLPMGQRLIHLTVARQKVFLCIMMENRC